MQNKTGNVQHRTKHRQRQDSCSTASEDILTDCMRQEKIIYTGNVCENCSFSLCSNKEHLFRKSSLSYNLKCYLNLHNTLFIHLRAQVIKYFPPLRPFPKLLKKRNV